MNDDDEEAELRNPFPSPPSHYTNYTAHNLNLLSLYKERTADTDAGELDQQKILSDQTDVPEWPLVQLEKPRVDWILEDGYYNVFGDTWFVKETIPTLGELGGHQLYPHDPSIDRRPALLTVLRSLLATYSKLTKSLLSAPPTASTPTPPDWERHVQWINTLAQNIMAAANDLRPVQARGNLELMMKRQLELRREETKTLHAKCDTLEARIIELRNSANVAATKSAKPSSMGFTVKNTKEADVSGIPQPASLTLDDVLRWAEEIK